MSNALLITLLPGHTALYGLITVKAHFDRLFAVIKP
jgi:hypothetical protein